CPNGSDPCEPGAPTQDQPVQISDPQSVIGSPEGGSIIVIGEGPEPSSNSVTVVRIPPSESGPPSASESPAAASTSPEVTATPNATPIRTATPLPTSSAPSPLAPSVAPSAPASAPPSTS